MFVADLHNDIVQRAMIGEDIGKLTKHGHTDFIRLKDSCIDLEILIIWVSTIPVSESAYTKANDMYDKLEYLAKSNKEVNIPKNLNEILENKKNNILSIPIGMEGGEAIENSLDKLHHFIERGMIYFGPTWNYSLDWVTSGKDELINKDKLDNIGLTDFGTKVVQTCNDNSVIIDVSHIGEKSFWDIASVSTKPFIASHSSVYKLCPHFRNLKDEQILEIKKSKGLIGLNPYPFFIDPDFKKKETDFIKKFSKEINQVGINEFNINKKWILKQHYLQNKLQEIVPSLEIFIDHIQYVTDLVGIDYVGIGSDYDGLDCLPKDWKDCLDHIKIAESLESRGYSNLDIEKIMGKNFLRVLEDAFN